jgi:hypothetical protein
MKEDMTGCLSWPWPEIRSPARKYLPLWIKPIRLQIESMAQTTGVSARGSPEILEGISANARSQSGLSIPAGLSFQRLAAKGVIVMSSESKVLTAC